MKDKKLSKEREKQKIHIKYDLEESEQRILDVAIRLSNEMQDEWVSIQALALELFPRGQYEKKLPFVSKNISKLESLSLVERSRDKAHIKITDKGTNILIDQFENLSNI